MNRVAVCFLASILVCNVLVKPAPAASSREKWESTLTEAKKEGKITIYGQVGPELRVALMKSLKDELGLELELVPGRGIEILTRFRTENQAGLPSADILLGGATAFLPVPELYAAWDRLEPQLILPEVLDTKAWPNNKLPFTDNQKKLLPIALQVNQLLVVNTNMVKPGQIKSFKDLLQPQWKGKMAMFDPTLVGPSQEWVKLLLTKAYGPVEGEAYLQKFAAQEPMITRDSRLQSEWVARSRYPVTVGLDSQSTYQMHKNGGPITRLAAEEGTYLAAGGSCLVMPAKRPHHYAAIAVLNWLLTPRGQEIYSKGYGAPPARLGVKTEGVSPLAFPYPGEKIYVQDEEDIIVGTKKAEETAKRIFAPLLK